MTYGPRQGVGVDTVGFYGGLKRFTKESLLHRENFCLYFIDF